MNRLLMGGALVVALLGAARPAQAQLNGENLLGDMGLKSGTQPAPGFYVSMLHYRYRTDTIRNRNGQRISFDPQQRGRQRIDATVPIALYVSPTTLLGGHYAAMAVVPFANGALEAPAFGLLEEASLGLGDAYFMPFQLGWHMRRADVTTSFAFFAPTGRYAADASDNLGKGMWSYELSAGATLYADQARTWSIAATGFWETHSRKQDTTLKVGQLFTIEGGAGKSFLDGAMHVGMAYYAQWKLTPDQIGLAYELPADATIGRHRVYALGPDVTIPIARKSKLISLVNVRYLWEVGARIKTEGPSLLLTTTFPLPSIKIPAKH